MFPTNLSTVEPFAGNELYDGVTGSWVAGSDLNGDVSMLATMRALLHTRRKDQQYHFSYLSISRDIALPRSDGQALFNKLRGVRETDPIPANTLYWITLRSINVHGVVDSLLAASNHPWTTENGYTRLSAAEQYLSSKCGMETVIFINQSTNFCVIFTNVFTLSSYHLVQSFLPLYFPALFKETPLTTEEKHLLECLTKRSADEYRTAMQEMGKALGLEEMAVRTLLQDFEKSTRKHQLTDAENQVNNARDNANDFRERYIRALRDLDESVLRYEGMRVALENTSESRELMDYFLAHKNLKLLSAADGRLQFIVSTYIDSFDVEGYEHLSKNGDIYNGINAGAPFNKVQNRKLLMDALFCENPKLKVRTCAYYRLSMDGEVNSSRGFNYLMYGAYENCIPNPHLQYHNCIGNNAPLITEQLRKGDTLSAVECCIASAMAVNIHETGLTFRPFIQEVMNSDKKVIENVETHECFTAQEALAWLIEQQSTEASK